jgi:thiamine kinase-like enzyme
MVSNLGRTIEILLRFPWRPPLTERKKLYEWALPRLLTRIEQRRQNKQHLTIVHQDAHPYNFLFPKDETILKTR